MKKDIVKVLILPTASSLQKEGRPDDAGLARIKTLEKVIAEYPFVNGPLKRDYALKWYEIRAGMNLEIVYECYFIGTLWHYLRVKRTFRKVCGITPVWINSSEKRDPKYLPIWKEILLIAANKIDPLRRGPIGRWLRKKANERAKEYRLSKD